MRPEEQSPLYKETVKNLCCMIQNNDDDSGAYAEASSEKLKELFIKCYKVTQSLSHPCIQRLLNKRCGYNAYKCQPPAADYASLWLKNGKPELYISQPYDFTFKDIQNNIKFCEQYELEFFIDFRATWHFPGRVIGIVYRKKQ